MDHVSNERRSLGSVLDDRLLLVMGGLLVVEAVLYASYALSSGATITNPLVFVYPFVWIDASLLALLSTQGPAGTSRQRAIAVFVAGGYFLVLGYFGGLFGLGHGSVPLHVDWNLPPGYGPAILYDGGTLRMVIEPYKVIGYLTLAYFVYATVVDAAVGAVSGFVGLFSCVSCSWPIIGTVATTLFGSSSAVASVALSQSYGLGTIVFLSALGLLYYRPLL